MKTITVVFYDREFAGEWKYPFDEASLAPFFAELNRELSACGVKFEFCMEPNITLRINGYGDLLNSIRVRSPQDGFSSLCLGQFIGPSLDTNLLADVKRGVRRVAFSPESIVPDGGSALCHNCGCGC
ncbi:MAG: hypothetical protein B6I37_04455 [Desulfobacteraceae bacterium 4572_35.2]|nr:MAG: hypothetical protein B6I37_04455 [Desulfobacteraceae bacterium 4572_35.2]